mgnify:FL=1
MDKQFEEWIDEFEKGWRNSKAYQTFAGKGYNEITYRLLDNYIKFKQNQSHEKLVKWTVWLVLGTWALAIGTIFVLIFK